MAVAAQMEEVMEAAATAEAPQGTVVVMGASTAVLAVRTGARATTGEDRRESTSTAPR